MRYTIAFLAVALGTTPALALEHPCLSDAARDAEGLLRYHVRALRIGELAAAPSKANPEQGLGGEWTWHMDPFEGAQTDLEDVKIFTNRGYVWRNSYAIFLMYDVSHGCELIGQSIVPPPEDRR